MRTRKPTSPELHTAIDKAANLRDLRTKAFRRMIEREIPGMAAQSAVLVQFYRVLDACRTIGQATYALGKHNGVEAHKHALWLKANPKARRSR